MKKNFLSSACSSFLGILRPRTILTLRCAPSPSVPNDLSYSLIKNMTSSILARFIIRCAPTQSVPDDLSYSPIKNIASSRQGRFSISCISTVGRNSESSPPMPKSVPVQVAHELLQAGHRYLDVRTPEEFSAGHAVGAINVPLLFKQASGMTRNPNFVEGVLSHFSKQDEIVVGCQAGRRSLIAAADLISAGYTGVTDVAGGYAAWTQNGLPIES